MDDPASSTALAVTSSRRRLIGSYCAKGALAVCAFVAALWVASWLIRVWSSDVSTSLAVTALLLAVMGLLLIGALAHEILYWRRPLMQLRQLLADVQAGEAPIEELKHLPRGMRSLSDPLHTVFHQLRLTKLEISQLDAEIHQRVVNRTESLERQLGALQTKASRDALTGLSNRRSLDEQLPKIVETCRAKRSALTLLMVDVDHFKVLNDTLGHQAGDDLLRSIGQIIRSTLREGDAAFRYGGDEFVLLLRCDAVGAEALANRLRHLVDGLTRHHRELPRRPQLTVGIASLDELSPTAPPAELVERADQRLYAIKHARPKDQQRVA